MKHFLLLYDTAPDYLARRPEFRHAHLDHANAAVARGELVLGGAMVPPDGAVLLFTAESEAVATVFAEGDPYVRAGLVTGWRVREWTTVVGKDALTPVV